MLIDSGASHNFVAPQMVASLSLAVEHSKRFAVKLGDGHRIWTAGLCSKIHFQMGDIQMKVDAYILDLGGVDAILGMAWLRTLGKIMVDYREMTMSFLY